MNSSVTPEHPLSNAEVVSLTGRMLGAIFYYSPDKADVAPIIDLLSHDGWATEWPCGDMVDIQQVALLIRSGLESENR